MKNKRILKTVVSLVCILSLLVCSAYADTSNSKDEENVKNQLKQLENKYNVKFIEPTNNDETLKFDSVEEFEKFLQTIKHDTTTYNLTINPSNNHAIMNGDFTQLTTYNDCDTITWWAPFSGWGMTGLACWHNVAFDYVYQYVNSKPQFVSVSNINSYLSGINVTWWDQTNSSYNITTTTNTNDTAKIKVVGRYVLGVEINGFTIGAVISGTWNCSLKLVP